VSTRNYSLSELARWADDEGGIISLLRHGIDLDLLPEDIPDDVRSAIENIEVMLKSDVEVVNDWLSQAEDEYE
jgi:hypothetical protein